jgi:hypothetical protein
VAEGVRRRECCDDDEADGGQPHGHETSGDGGVPGKP